jgi:hypothetical protein
MVFLLYIVQQMDLNLVERESSPGHDPLIGKYDVMSFWTRRGWCFDFDMTLENYNPMQVVTVIEDLQINQTTEFKCRGCPHHSHNTMVACRGRETMGERCHDVESSRKSVAATFSSWRSKKRRSITFHCGCDNGTTWAENVIGWNYKSTEYILAIRNLMHHCQILLCHSFVSELCIF